METKDFIHIKSQDFKWMNEPEKWIINLDVLEVTTGYKTDFWVNPQDGSRASTGHLFGVNIKDDFVFSATVEAEYTQLYDQAGIMIYLDETHWLKAGIEYEEDQCMISSVFTNGGASDWAIGVYPGDSRKFHIRIIRKDGLVTAMYSVDGAHWSSIRKCKFPEGICLVGPMCCTPTRAGLEVKFSGISVQKPDEAVN